jgi:hypothetical protein
MREWSASALPFSASCRTAAGSEAVYRVCPSPSGAAADAAADADAADVAAAELAAAALRPSRRRRRPPSRRRRQRVR